MCAASLRSLAEKLNLSHATVSAALSGKSCVKASTRAKILAAAETLGYRNNPLASAMMSQLRRSQGSIFRGTVGLLSMEPAASTKEWHKLYEQTLIQGATQRAEQLGFKLDHIRISRNNVNPQQLAQTIDARGIRGVLLTDDVATLLTDQFDWSNFAGILIGGTSRGSHLDVIGPDHQAAMDCAWSHVQNSGYTRPALVLDADTSAPEVRSWQAAYYACHPPKAFSTSIQPLVVGRDDRALCLHWLSEHSVDVVLADSERVLAWINCPDTPLSEKPGFCALAQTAPGSGISGVDLRGHATGMRGVDLITTKIQRNEIGLPDLPVVTLVPPDWISGDSLRAQETLQTSAPRGRHAA